MNRLFISRNNRTRHGPATRNAHIRACCRGRELHQSCRFAADAQGNGHQIGASARNARWRQASAAHDQRIAVTPEGKAYYEKTIRVVKELADIDSEFGATHRKPKGHLRINVGASLAWYVLIPALTDFL